MGFNNRKKIKLWLWKDELIRWWKNRKICVVTGSRAEYGLLKFLMDEINNSESLELILLVTGTHLSKEFGFTVKK